jgi:hypothetical protein
VYEVIERKVRKGRVAPNVRVCHPRYSAVQDSTASGAGGDAAAPRLQASIVPTLISVDMKLMNSL